MKFFSNPGVKSDIIFWLAFSVLFSVTAVVFEGKWIITVAACAFFFLIHFFNLAKRYRQMSKMSDEIENILHNMGKFELSSFNEGELSIMRSAVYKLTVRLRDQTSQLKQDKVYLSDSLADISHQIRTPLTSMNIIANMLLDPKLNDERRVALTRELISLLSRVDGLINALLKISRLDAGTVPFSSDNILVRDMVKKAYEPIEVPMDIKDQTLVTDIPKDAAYIGDMQWSVEAMGNILKNCMEHTPEGGCITVTSCETPLFTEIAVSDTGPGISEKDMPHLFKRFYKGENSSSNSFGIGLALARMIIKEQNGTITARNGLSGGAVFTIRFYKGTV